MSARVLEHVAATSIPFDTVKADIEKRLKAQESAALAKSSGEATLAELNKGGDDNKLAWSATKSVSRLQDHQAASPAALQAVFKADVEKLPAYAGAAVGDSYTFYKIVKVVPLETIDEAKRKGLQSEYGALVAKEDMAAYLSGLHARYKISINKDRLESKERQ